MFACNIYCTLQKFFQIRNYHRKLLLAGIIYSSIQYDTNYDYCIVWQALVVIFETGQSLHIIYACIVLLLLLIGTEI